MSDISILIDHDGTDFVVTTDESPSIRKHLEALLAARFIPDRNLWRLDWRDLQSLKDRLEEAGVTEGRACTDDALTVIDREASMDALARDTSRDGSPLSLPLIKSELYSDQRAGVRFLLHRKGVILADAMGSGKSLMILSAYSLLRERGEKGPLLVLCPNNVKPNWFKEVQKHTKLKVAMIGNGREDVQATVEVYAARPIDVFVVHYDALIDSSRQAKFAWSNITEILAKIPFAAIACDEAHLLKNTTSKRTLAVKFLASASNSRRRVTRIWLATGTPVSETPNDAFSLLSMIEPSVLPTHTRFLGHFILRQEVKIGLRVLMQDAGFKNIPDLQRLFTRCMIRRDKIDLKGFPDKIESHRAFKITGEQKKLYASIKKGELDPPVEPGEMVNAAQRIVKLRQCLISPKLLEKEGDSAKLEALDEIVEEVLSNPDEKILIWTEYRVAVDLIAERYKRFGSIKLYAGQAPEDMLRFGATWDTSPERVAVAIPAFAGTGVDFLARCRTSVYVDIPFSTVLLRQSLDRTHRRIREGATDKISKIKASPAHIIFLHAEGTVDDLVFGAVEEKANFVDAILDAQAKISRLSPEELLALTA